MKNQTINDTFATIDLAFKNGEKDNFFSKDNQYICISEYNELLWNELLENGFSHMEYSEVVRIGREQKPLKIEMVYQKIEPIKQKYTASHGSWHGYCEPEFPDREGQND